MKAKNPIDQLADQPVQWLSDDGPDAGITVSTRIRLARNLAGIPFPTKANTRHRQAVLQMVREAVAGVPLMDGCIDVKMSSLAELDRVFLLERHLISREHCSTRKTGNSVFVARGENCSIMVNEEDHLRLQVMTAGMQLEELWQLVDHVDSLLTERLQYAYSDDLGFLTACPTNVGTGIRASVMLHLPGLVFANQIEAITQAVHTIGFAVRGLYGEGSDTDGNLFQISNQSTLGESEIYIIEKLEKIIRQIVEHERNARQVLLERKPKYLYDHIGRAYGILRHAYILESSEALRQLSALRLGIDLSMFSSIDAHTINELLVMIQPGHLQKIHNRTLDENERDIARADIVRGRLSGSKRETTDEQSH